MAGSLTTQEAAATRTDAEVLADYDTSETCRFSLHPHHDRCDREAVYGLSGWDTVCQKQLTTACCDRHLTSYLDGFEIGAWCECTGCSHHTSINIKAHRLA